MTTLVLLVSEQVLRSICVAIGFLGSLRFILLGSLAVVYWTWARRRHRPDRRDESYRPFVTVLVPAYQEEKVIARTIQSLLESDYQRLEIVVVDDGSSDRTADVVRQCCVDESRVRLFSQPRRGKAAALNHGLSEARGDVVVTVDADTVVSREAVGLLAQCFADPRVGAVAGNLKVGNRVNMVTRCQAIEYITAQSIGRRAFALLDCMTVVPGPIGGWRRAALDRVGGFPTETVVEDQDLTLRVRKLGYSIRYEERALAWTEAPDTIHGLYRQRRRWMFGTLQCMWRHRDALLRPRYGTLGLVGIPNMWIGILIAMMLPIADLMFAASVVVALSKGIVISATTVQRVLGAYVLVLVADWATAAIGFLLEGKEQWSLLPWMLPQRFYYRQVMYLALMGSVGTALLGGRIGWEGLERRITKRRGLRGSLPG